MADEEEKPPPPPIAKLPDVSRQVRVLTDKDVGRVVGELVSLADKWHDIGVALRLTEVFMRDLKKAEKPPQESLREVVAQWLGGYSPCPNWEVLAEALRAKGVGAEHLAGQLDEKYSGETGVADRDPSLPLGCGIKDCVCGGVVSCLRQDSTSLSFPYLEWSKEAQEAGDRDEFVRKLTIEHREVVADYDLFYTYTWKAILRNEATVEKLLEYLNQTRLYQPYAKIRYPIIDLFHHLQGPFKGAESLKEMLLILRQHIDVFTHNLLVDVLLNLSGNMRDRRRLDNFRDKYYYYMRRKASLFPKVYSPPTPSGYALVFFTLKKDIDKITLSEVDSFANRLTYNLSITRFALRLVALVREREGAVSFVYQMPSFCRNFVFPLTEEQIHAMRGDEIIAIKCCSYKIDIPVKAPEGVEEKYGTHKFYSDDPQPEDEPMEVEEPPPEVPLYASLPPPSPFRLEPDKVLVPPALKRMQERCRGVDNYVVMLPDAPSKTLYAAMVLCQHAARRRENGQFVKCVVLTNTKPRAHEVMDRLKELLPSINLYIFTGTEQDSITIKINLDKDIVLVCTTGKFHQELEAEVVRFGTVSLFLVDDCQHSPGQTMLKDAFHKYLLQRYYRSLKPPVPQIVGLTTNPAERATALDEEAMQKHILKVAGGVDSTLGIFFGSEVLSDTYTPASSSINSASSANSASAGGSSSKPRPKPEFHVKKFQMRDTVKDVVIALQVEMRTWEDKVDLIPPHYKWTPGYGEVVRGELESAVAALTGGGGVEGGSPAPAQNEALRERVQVLELLQCYAQALRACVEFGPDSALAILQAPVTSSSSILTREQADSLEALGRELQHLIGQRSAVLEAVNELVCSRLSGGGGGAGTRKTRGLLFVDSLRQAQFLCAEIGRTHFLARPAVVPRYLVANYSTDACSELEKIEQHTQEELERGREALEAFARGECSLLIIPYAVERDSVELENVRSEFDFIARVHKITRRDDFINADYVAVIMLSPEPKSFPDLRRDFNMCRMEAGLRSLPTGQALKKKLTRAREDVMNSYQSRHFFPTRTKKQKNEVFVEQITLRCKKCRVYVCQGVEIFSFFVDGGRHCVVPHRDFCTRYNAKPYHGKHKAIKRINRLKKIFCGNCGSPWGLICHFPSKGCQLPVIKAKHFIFEMDRKFYSIKLWTDALFRLPPITAFPDFHVHGTVEMERD